MIMKEYCSLYSFISYHRITIIEHSPVICLSTMIRVQTFFKFVRRNSHTTGRNIVKSTIEDVTIPNISLPEYLWRDVSKWSQKIATICLETNRQYTYAELHKNSLSLTKFLKDSLKLQQQTTVAVILPNLPEYPIVLIGALQAGLRVTTINPAYTAEEITNQLISSESKLIFCSDDLVPTIRKTLQIHKIQVPVVSVKYQSTQRPVDGIDLNEIISGEICDPIQVNLNDTALLPYSSGTTGLPKGVQLTHRNIVANLSQFAVKEITPLWETTENHQDVVPAFLPFFHAYGLIMIMLNGIAHGNKLVTMPKFSSENFLKMAKRFKPHIIYGVPATVQMITNNPLITVDVLTELRTIISGAAPLRASDLERFYQKTQSKINLLQAYGMTETSPLTLFQTVALENGCKIGGCGVLLPNTEARVIPIDDNQPNENLPPNQSGELLFRGPQIMKGYYKNPQANKEVFLADNWLKTGDVGYYDEDGHFYITDRLKEFIKVRGFQVAPAELEALLRDHADVEDVAVIGVQHQQFGEVPKAFVVPKQNQRINVNDLIEFVAKRTVKYKHLVGGVVVVDSIPKNPSGKILRRLLRNLQ